MTLRLRSVVCAALITVQSLGLSPLLASEQAASGQARGSKKRGPVSAMGDNMDRGLQVRLSEGDAGSAGPASVAAAQATRLSDGDTESLLNRLEPIKAGPADEKDFAVREGSLPPPRTGATVKTSFPAPEQSDAPDSAASGPLDLLRYSPEGDVPLAPQLSLTFSRPMVAVTSHKDAATGSLPVRLSPQPPGQWRWVGTRTLLFDPDVRFPMATEYSVEVPAGVRSATGALIAAPRSWKFKTPPPQVKSSYPTDGPHRRDPVFFVEFDQRVDPKAVLDTIRLGAGRREWRARLATEAEIAADEVVSRYAAAAAKDRWVAFRVANPAGDAAQLPADTIVSVSIGPGTPSLEGPLKTASAQGFTFRTYGPLRVIEHRCGYQQCTPFDDWYINFSNPLDVDAFDRSQVRVEPAVPGLKTELYGNTIAIRGLKRGRTTYRVTLDGAIRDQFGQTLGQDASFTFDVKSAEPSLAASGGPFVVLDPSGQPHYSVFSINHSSLKYHIYKVGPEHWQQYLAFHRNRDEGKGVKLPGRLVVSDTTEVKAEPDEMAETRIDLGRALDGGVGQIIIQVEPTVQVKGRYRQPVLAWVQATAIGLDAFVDHTELIGWATSLKDGKPIDGAALTIQPSGASATTRADGLAYIPLKESQGRLLVARKGRDVAILPENKNWWDGGAGWARRGIADSLRWFVFDDRKMYRPGEEVHIKGWVRRVGGGKEGDVGPLQSAGASVAYTLKDSRGNDTQKGAARLNALGGFDAVLKLPPTMNLGRANLQLEIQGAETVAGTQHYHAFQVQEFRRPEFEVTASSSEGPHFVGGKAVVTTSAAYYAGGGLPNAEVNWRVTTSPGYFTPPNRGDFTFGKWVPWWMPSYTGGEARVEAFAGRTDAAGKHRLQIDFVSVNPPRPTSVKAEASVMDVNRQAWNASANILVHPADLYVGIRSPRTFVQRGEPLIVQSIVTDLDGKAVANRLIKMRAVLLDWVYEKGEWRQKEIGLQECTVRSTSDAVECRFEAREGGTYRVTATIEDDRERKNESELTLWVAGGKVVPRRDLEQEDVSLIPDRREYRPGDTAEVLVQAPFYPAEGVLSLRRSGILKTERFNISGPSHTLKVPILEGHIPNLHVQVDLVGAAARTDDKGEPNEKLPRRPAFAKGVLTLSVPALSRKLTVQATPRDKALEPGGKTIVDLEVRDAAGEPVAGGELAVVVVDEAILALTGYRMADPITVFYSQRGADAHDYHLRKDILLANPESLRDAGPQVGDGISAAAVAEMAAPPRPAPMAARMMKDGGDQQGDPIRLRENFEALATFAAAVPTDANGRASVEVKLPDNLTRYRVMAVAVAGGKQFGLDESAITGRLPLMVRPSAPRFLNFGDRFELPVVVQNQTDAAMDVDVVVRASNAELTEGGGRRVTVPANDRVEVRFPASAARAGTARFQVAGVSGGWADAAEIQLPVWTPATTEAFATYGEIDEGAMVQPIKAPSDAVRQFGGLEVTTSSTQLQALTDAVLYLVAYRFECAEQLSSRIIAVAALRDVLAAFEAKGLPKPEEMVAAVARDIKRLQSMQNDDGGFGFWRRGDESWPYVSIHVAHALQRAKEKRFDVPAQTLERSRSYLRNIESNIPKYYAPDSRRALVAYALYVRNRLGDRDTATARRLIAEAGLENLSLEAAGWLLPVLSGDAASQAEVAAIRRLLNNRVTETAATAHFATSYKDGEHLLLHSSRRADGVILEALIGDQPHSDLVPKIVRGLLAHRKAGRWENTQENAFVLLALDKYFSTYEKATPDFVARAWLGRTYAGGREFKGRTTERHQVNVPMRILAETGEPQNLILSKQGPGRLYYRVGMQYAPASLKLDAADHGFTVERVYEAVEKADDVRRDADGAWRIKAGAQVRVRLTMVAPSRRYHVALVDPLPAGLEALNPALAVTGSIPQDAKSDAREARWWWWHRPWFEHQNLRDERVEAFASLLWGGVYTYSYVARATTPGIFVVPPPKAEEMYHPETFGRGASDRVIVE